MAFRCSVLLGTLIAFAPARLLANTLYFPQVVFGGGYSTTLSILNTGTTPVVSNLDFYDQSGTPRLTLRKAINLRPGGSTRITLPNTGPLTVVWGELAAGSGTVEGSANYALRTDGGALLSTATVQGVEAANAFRTPVDMSSTVSTGIAIAHVRQGGVLNVGARLLREDGSQAAAASDVRLTSLVSREQVADFVTGFFPQLGSSDFKGTLVIEAPAGAPANSLAVTAVRLKQGTLSGVPLTTRAGTLYFPQVVFGDGYSTTLIVMNTGAAAVSSRVNFYSQDGNPRSDLGSTINLAPGGSTRLELPDGGAMTVLWAEIAPGAGMLQGSAIIDRRAANGTLLSSASGPAVEARQRFVFPADATTIASTGIAIANVRDGEALNVSVRLVREDGMPLQQSDVRLPLGSKRQTADFISGIFHDLLSLSAGGAFKGTVVIEAAPGSTANSANALVATAFNFRESGSAMEPSESLLTALPRDLTSAEARVTEVATNFSLALWARTNAGQAGENVFMSPLSASFALGMTMNGAANQTFDEMRAALGFGTATNQEINEGYRSLIALLSRLDPAVKMQIANSIWYRDTFRVLSSFLNTCSEYFDAEVRGLNFNDVQGSLATINGWVAGKTNDKISSILQNINPLDVMILINAIYFNGNWRDKFDMQQTQQSTFRPARAAPQPASLMHRHARMSYTETPAYQAVDLPYGNSAFSMTVLLPSETTDIETLAASLTPPAWRTLTGNMQSTDVDLYLPKLKLEYERTLNDDLQAMGMSRAFDPARADFSRIADAPLYISLVKQKTFVDVNEAGTEAAAVTAAVVTVTSAPPPPKLMRVDRPYIFIIRERLSGNILFMGKIVRMPAN